MKKISNKSYDTITKDIRGKLADFLLEIVEMISRLFIAYQIYFNPQPLVIRH